MDWNGSFRFWFLGLGFLHGSFEVGMDVYPSTWGGLYRFRVGLREMWDL